MKAALAVLLSASLVLAQVAQALEIHVFDKIAPDDQIDYVGDLVDSVERSVPASELPRVKRFFQNKQPGEVISGMGQFELNLSLARVADLQAAEKDPRARRLQVEDVMYVTLERNGIKLPAGFRPIANTFHATRPPRRQVMDKAAADRALAETRTWVARNVEAPREFRANRGGYGLSDTEKGIAFFAALALIVAAAAKSSGSSSGGGGGGGGPEYDSRPWWEQSGYNTYGDAIHGACIASHTPSMSGGYSGICD